MKRKHLAPPRSPLHFPAATNAAWFFRQSVNSTSGSRKSKPFAGELHRLTVPAQQAFHRHDPKWKWADAWIAPFFLCIFSTAMNHT